ncbi:hypothetical protein PVK06_024050 [Gossypium arboreum]|uniref:Uncharacterized protein n=1 Tax=Gossypium arboreum TaxID=29729 RepID=A0ABR0PCY3_GOSAR|nr:hypothetical protein PVK06_024050 [Gossypium arboreum]
MSMVLTTIFTSSSRLPSYILTRNKFERTSYFDLRIQVCIPFEFLVNSNIWHVKVALVVYDMVKMPESDKVMWQFRFRQTISSAP